MACFLRSPAVQGLSSFTRAIISSTRPAQRFKTFSSRDPFSDGLDRGGVVNDATDSRLEAGEISRAPEGADRNRPLKRDVGQPLRTLSKPGTLTIPKEFAMDKAKDAPKLKEDKSYNIETILQELKAIQNTG